MDAFQIAISCREIKAKLIGWWLRLSLPINSEAHFDLFVDRSFQIQILKMNSRTFSKLSSFLAIFFLLVALAGADKALIREECQNADVPAVCVKYVESDPRSTAADRVGIATIIVDNLDHLAGTLAANITALASTGKANETEKKIKRCAKAYSSVKLTELVKAKEELKKGNYDKAELWISEAIHLCYLSCLNVDFPVDVGYDIHVYEDLTNAAQRIIERF